VISSRFRAGRTRWNFLNVYEVRRFPKDPRWCASVAVIPTSGHSRAWGYGPSSNWCRAVIVFAGKDLASAGWPSPEALPTLTPDAIRSILLTLVSRIDIRAEHVEIRVYRHRFHDLIQARSLEPFLADPALRAIPAIF
jgi:hypothetical protein